MGCSQSKLDDEEAVQLCKDRKKFIKQAVEHRARFASGHLAYIQSLKRVSAALREYIELDEPHEFSLDSFVTPPFTTPVKKPAPEFITISPSSLSRPQIKSAPKSAVKVNYLMSSGPQAVAVEERPRSPETFRVETYSSVHQYGVDSFFSVPSSDVSSTFYQTYSPLRRPVSNVAPPSPQTSQWDFFWNPFSSLDYYGYTDRGNYDHTVVDDEIRGLKQVREEEGIPELEADESESEELPRDMNKQRAEVGSSYCKEEVMVEDVDEEDDDEEDDGSDEDVDEELVCDCDDFKVQEPQEREKIAELSRVQTSGQVEAASKQEMAVRDKDSKEEYPGFTVYVNRRPTSMAEVMKDLEDQFTIVCKAANEVSVLLEAGKAQYLSASSELTPMKMLNPVALFRSGSSRSSSSRFLISSSGSSNNGYESNSDLSDEACMLSGSHQSTLDRLYAWEKKLYAEVRSGERVRIAYEKKCMQLRNQDVKGDDPSSLDKTRATIRDLHTQIKVSIHSIEAISKRIEALRDDELQPQLLELAQGLTRMWKVMAECHQMQKRTLDEAKILLAGAPSKLHRKRHSSVSDADPIKLARSASNLETELRNWRACFEIWITSQRSYIHALAGWLLRCIHCEPHTSNLPFSPRRSSSTLPIYGICIQWSRFLDNLNTKPVLEGLDFFAAGMGSLYAQQLKEDSKWVASRTGPGNSPGPGGGLEVVEVGQVEEVMTAEKMAEFAIRVLCAGMSLAMSSLADFAVCSADGYAEFISQWEDAKWKT